MAKTVAEAWPEFFKKSKISMEHRVELGGMAETVGDMCDAVVTDPDGFVALVQQETSEGIMFLMPFFEEIADLPNSKPWLEAIKEAILGKARSEDIAEINRLLA